MSNVDINSAAVQSYLTILQTTIARMGTNSASTKAWCIGLVSAVVVIVADKGEPDYVWIALGPLLLFFFLDSYYLGLEKRFRDLYDGFVSKLHTAEAQVKDLFVVTAGVRMRTSLYYTLAGTVSLSVWPFYGLLLAMLVIARECLLSDGGCATL